MSFDLRQAEALDRIADALENLVQVLTPEKEESKDWATETK